MARNEVVMSEHAQHVLIVAGTRHEHECRDHQA